MINSLLKGLLFKLFDFIRPLIVIPFFIRNYGLESYGIYVQIVFISLLLYPVLDLGIQTGIQRFSKEFSTFNERLDIFNFQKFFILFFILLYIIIVNISSFAALLWGQYESCFIKIFTLLYIVFFSFNNTLQGVLRADSKISILVRYKLFFVLFEALLLIFILYVHEQFDFVYIGGMFIAQLFYCYFLNRETEGLLINFRIKTVLDKKTIDFFKYSLFIIPTALIAWITSSSDRFFITNYFGSEVTGYYSILAQYSGYMTLLVFPFTFVFFKDYAVLFDKDFKCFLVFYVKTFSLCILMSAVYFLIFYKLKVPIFKYYIGIEIKDEFSILVTWFLITFFLINIASFLSTFMLVSRQTTLMLIVIFAGAITNFVLNKFFLKDLSYVNAVYYWAASVLVQIIIMSFFLLKTIIRHEKSSIC